MRKTLIALVLTGIGVLVLCQVANGDVIHLRNGRRLKGMVVDEDDKEIEVEIECGTVRVKRREIEKIEYGLLPVRRRRTRKTEEPDKTEKAEKGRKAQKEFPSEDEYLKQPEIDIGTATLIIARRFYPKLDIQKYLDKLDAMAKELEADLETAKTAQEIVETMGRYFFVKQKFTYKENVHLLNMVLDGKSGNCNGLTILYLALAERLNLPFYGVNAPLHIFVRYDDGKTRINVETTTKDLFPSEEQSIKTLTEKQAIPRQLIDGRVYLRNLRKKEVLAGYYTNCGNIYFHKGDYAEDMKVQSKAISLNSRLPLAYHNRGETYRVMGNYDRAIRDYSNAISLGMNLPGVYCGRGHCYLFKGELDYAVRDFNKALSIDPKNADALTLRAIYYARRKEKGNMLQDLRKALELDPSSKRQIVRNYEEFKDWWQDEEFKRVTGINPGKRKRRPRQPVRK